MITPEQELILRRAILTYGPDNQMHMVIEEMSELTTEICHYLRHRPHNIYEELADVKIMIAQLEIIFPNNNIEEWIDLKLSRLKERVDAK